MWCNPCLEYIFYNSENWTHVDILSPVYLLTTSWTQQMTLLHKVQINTGWPQKVVNQASAPPKTMQFHHTDKAACISTVFQLLTSPCSIYRIASAGAKRTAESPIWGPRNNWPMLVQRYNLYKRQQGAKVIHSLRVLLVVPNFPYHGLWPRWPAQNDRSATDTPTTANRDCGPKRSQSFLFQIQNRNVRCIKNIYRLTCQHTLGEK